MKLQHDGHPVGDIEIPAKGQTNLESHTGLVLDGARRPLQPGQWFPVTFRFAHAGTVTVPIMAGPAFREQR